jgi:hypothetical protein
MSGESMNKLLFWALIISVGFNIFQINSIVDVVSVVTENPIQKSSAKKSVIDKVHLAQSSLSKSLSKNLKKCDCSNISDLDTKELKSETMEKAYDEKAIAKKLKNLKLKWEKDSQEFFYNDLRLRDDQIERYKELVKMRKHEADDYFEPKIKNAQVADQENGGLPYYIHSTEDTVFLGKLAERYDSLLHENFGDQAFSDYKKFINKHNKETIKEDIFFPIEF